MSSRRSVFVLAFLFIAISVSAQNQGAAGSAAAPCRSLPPLSPEAQQIASEIGAMPMLARLRTVWASCEQSSTTALEEMVLHQRIDEAIAKAALGTDGVIAEVDYERAEVLDLRDLLTGERDRKINLLNLANIIAGTGSGILSNVMQFSATTIGAGNAIGAGGGAAGVVLSVIGLRVHGGKGSLGVSPNMLAPLFARKPESRSVYPEDVWNYLNTAPVSDPRIHIPWREELIKDWVAEKRIGPPGAPQSQKRIGLLTSRIAEHKLLPIDVLTDRAQMLLDLRGRVALMNNSLRELVSALADVPASVPGAEQ